LRAAPRLPPVWRGVSLNDETLAATIVAALRGGQTEREFLASLYEEDVLFMFPTGHPDAERLLALRDRWRRRADICQQMQLRLATEEHEARKRAAASAGFADFDQLVYGQSEVSRAPEAVPHAILLAPEFAPEEIEHIRQRVAAAFLDQCAWFRSAGSPAEVPVETLGALDTAVPRARRFAEEHRARQTRLDEAALAEAAALRAEVDTMLRTARAFAKQSAGALHVRAGLQGVYETFQRLAARAHAEPAAHAHFDPIRRTLQRVGTPFVHIIDALDRLDHLARVRSVVLRDGWPLAIALVGLPFLARLPALLGLELVVVLGGLGWYGYERASAVDRIRRHAARFPVKVEE
jgi:hypothetical protein